MTDFFPQRPATHPVSYTHLDVYKRQAVEILADEYGWSSSVPNLSDKLKRGSLRYGEAVELADVLGYDIVWQKRREVR